VNQQFVGSIEHEADRQAIRRVGRLLHGLALESDQNPADAYNPRAELRAFLAELRYLHGYLGKIHLWQEKSTLPRSDGRLARFAGRLAGRVGALIAAVESQLQPAAVRVRRGRRQGRGTPATGRARGNGATAVDAMGAAARRRAERQPKQP
jgi:hypothetical protein